MHIKQAVSGNVQTMQLCSCLNLEDDITYMYYFAVIAVEHESEKESIFFVILTP